MGNALLSSLGPGAALAGVLLVAGVAAAQVGRRIPHLGVGALAPAAAVVATRTAGFGRAGAIAIALLVGAGLGAAGWVVNRRAGADGSGAIPLLGDVGVAGLALAVSVLFRPAVFVELPLGPLGGVATTGYGLAAAGVAAAAAVVAMVLVSRDHPDLLIWTVATAGGAVAVLLGSGALSLLAAASTPVFTIADTIGLGLRAAAVGFAVRSGLAWGVAGAALLGFGEAAARALPVPTLALVPAVLLLAGGALLVWLRQAEIVDAT